MTPVSATSPVLVTKIVHVTVPPLTICCESAPSAFLRTLSDGFVTSTLDGSLSEIFGPTGGVPVTVMTLVKSLVTFVRLQVKLVPAPAARFGIACTQFGANGSTAVTPVSATSPVLVTKIVHVTVPPLTICCESAPSAFLRTLSDGFVTSTLDGSLSVTTTACGEVPVAVTTLVKSLVTFALVQVKLVPAPGGRFATACAQFGASGSMVLTLVKVTLPVLVTAIVHVTVLPLTIVWLSAPSTFLRTLIDGLGGGLPTSCSVSPNSGGSLTPLSVTA